MITYPCGCCNAMDETHNVLRCVSKCEHHKQMMLDHPSGGQAYYTSLSLLDEYGFPRCGRYEAELLEAVGSLPQALKPGVSKLLEVGCGVSPYYQMLTSLGYAYLGIDADPWAAEHMRMRGVACLTGNFDVGRFVPGDYELVFSAHCLEHMPDAPKALQDWYGLLQPGGYLFLLVPDDADPTNPDHWWFFSEASLRACVERVGFEIVRFAARQVVAKEKFLYCLARKARP